MPSFGRSGAYGRGRRRAWRPAPSRCARNTATAALPPGSSSISLEVDAEPALRGRPARPGRACRAPPPGASSTRPYLASWRRWKLAWLAGMPSSRATSAARIGPAAASSSRIRLRTGWAIARSTRGSWIGSGGRRPWRQSSRIPHALLRNVYLRNYMVRDMTGYRQLARNHDFTVLWIGETISELGSRVSMFVFPLLAYALTGSALCGRRRRGRLPARHVRALLPAGVLADRVDRRLADARRPAAPACCSTPRSRSPAALGTPHGPPPRRGRAADRRRAGAVQPRPRSPRSARSCATEDLPTALSQNQARQHVASLVGGPLGGAAVRRRALGAVRRRRGDLRRLLRAARPDPHRPLGPAARRSAPHAAPATWSRASASSWARPFFRALMVWAALANLLVNALFFVAMLRLVQDGFHPAADRPGLDRRRHRRHPRRARRAVRSSTGCATGALDGR